jgi:hypothetical protein
VDRQADTDVMKPLVSFRSFANAPKNLLNSLHFMASLGPRTSPVDIM